MLRWFSKSPLTNQVNERIDEFAAGVGDLLGGFTAGIEVPRRSVLQSSVPRFPARALPTIGLVHWDGRNTYEWPSRTRVSRRPLQGHRTHIGMGNKVSARE